MLVMANLAANNGVPGGLALLIGIAVGTACGFLNGLLVTRLNLPPFIVTLGTLSIYTAIGLLYSGGASVGKSKMPAILNLMGTRFPIGPFRLTIGVVVVALLAAVVAFVLSQTSWGRHLYAVGDDIEAARLVTLKAARMKDAGQRSDLEAGMAKLIASETGKECVEQSFRIHGGYGYSKEYEIERLYRDAPLLLIGEGTSEIQRMVIGKKLLQRHKI